MEFYVNAISILATFLTLLYFVTTKKFDYWKKKKVPHERPLPLFGNYMGYILLQKCQANVSQDLCRKFPKEPYFGSFYGTEPALVIQDPELIKLVFTKDFYYFNSRELMDYTEHEVVSSFMFFDHGDHWKVVRQNMTSLFTSARLKNMFKLIEKCSLALEDVLERETKSSDILQGRNIMIRYAMDGISTSVFGVEANTLSKDGEKNVFTKMGQQIFSNSYSRGFKNLARTIWPNIFYGLRFKSFPVELNKFFEELLTQVFVDRGYKPSDRNDFIDLLLNLKSKRFMSGDSMSNREGQAMKIELEVDDKLMIAQCMGFFGAGFETSAGALSLTIYELAKNELAQRRAQEEVDDYLQRHNNKLSYECITELPFLQACVNETHRLYPVLPIISREVVQDYTFPSGLQLERGMRVHLPVYHLHRSEDLFPDPEAYKPERFMPNEGHTIKPYTFFPFGEGPRTCIGMRFAKMQVIAGLITFLKTFNVELADGTPETLKFETTTFLLQPASDLAVKVTKRKGWENRLFAK